MVGLSVSQLSSSAHLPGEQLYHLTELARLVRRYILMSTSAAQSGHPTSSLSAVELMIVLMFSGFFHFDADKPQYPHNDRLIFSKGHASPLFYALWAAAGKVSQEELWKLRAFGSELEGHPTMAFPYTEVPTGSLGQGLSVGVGMAMNAKYLDHSPYRTFVLLGDSEMAEGSNWEAIQLAAHYKLDNLVGIIDVNRLGQRGETMYGHDTHAFAIRVGAFGWETIEIDGHNLEEVFQAYAKASQVKDRPVMIIARTLKGKGYSGWENKEDFHSKTLKPEQLDQALSELGKVDNSLRGKFADPHSADSAEKMSKTQAPVEATAYQKGELVPTKKAFGEALTRLYPHFPQIVCLDAEVSNSTHTDIFQKKYPQRFFEMFIAEQNMVGVAMGFARRGKIPFVSSFGAFFSRAYDQIRMAGQAQSNIKIVGSYVGVSVGKDGSSQMALEDIAFFRTILHGVILYPSDAVSTEKLVAVAAGHQGLVYLRTTREATPVLYSDHDEFMIGGSKVLRQSERDDVTVVGAGITLHEALKAYDVLAKQGVFIRVIDLYSVKPVDKTTLRKAALETKAIIVVEDHYAEGGIAEAVRTAVANDCVSIHSLAVRKAPRSGTPAELLEYEEISAAAIVKKVQHLVHL